MAENDEIRLAVGGGDGNGAAIIVAANLGNKNKIHKLPPHLRKLGNKKKIQKLPPHLRSKEDSSVHDPKVVSIGPYHHGKPELQLVQGIKRKVLDHFISNSSSSQQQQQDYELYFKKMLEVVHTARSCYIMDDEEFDDDQFAEIMMLLDACFLLNHFLITTNYGDDFANNEAVEYYSPLDITTLIDAAAGLFFTERDTLLLDNQIPLWIIQLLFNAIYCNNPLHTWKQLLSIRSQQAVWEEIVYENADELEKHVMLQHDDEENEAPLHLLEFYHMLMVSHPSSSSEAAGIGNTPMKSIKEFIDEYGYLFRSVMDLKSKGIHFSRNYTDSTLRGIKFHSNLLRAKVMLPFFNASTSTRVSLQNIIAYELCNFTPTQFVVGSYINFMKSLVVSPGDVKELREKGIIRSTFGEDKEVVKLLHGLNTYDVDNPIIFRDVKRKILKYYNSKTKTWMAELAHTYFRTPWTAIALLAATFLLVLTFLQTYFTINPRGQSPTTTH